MRVSGSFCSAQAVIGSCHRILTNFSCCPFMLSLVILYHFYYSITYKSESNVRKQGIKRFKPEMHLNL